MLHMRRESTKKLLSSLKEETRSLKIDWISCNSCNNWVHPQCSGINKKKFTKIDKITKSSKTENNFFKCLKCSFQSATGLGVDLTKIIFAGKRKSVDTQTDSSNSLISDTSKTH